MKRFRRRAKPAERTGIDEFIIFGHMRCGSTTLVRALEKRSDICILNEPFNSNFTTHRPGSRDYLALASDERSIEEQLDHMYLDHNGIKTLGYQIPWELSAHMLQNDERRVVFMTRDNILQTVVSGLISQQTGIWHRWDAQTAADETQLEALSIDFLRRAVADVAEEIAYFAHVVAGRNGPTMHVTYEELYLQPADERQRVLASVFTFLGAEAPPPDATDDLLDPARTRLNSERTYLRLPNARELDAALGNDTTGRLFAT